MTRPEPKQPPRRSAAPDEPTMMSEGTALTPSSRDEQTLRERAPTAAQPITSDKGQRTVVGRYIIRENIGAGGMGAVYAAHDPQLDRTVAVKLLHAGVDEARLVREAKALAKLAHPNVITVHDVGTYVGGVFLAMEFVKGSTLKAWMRAGSRSWRDVVRVFVDAGRGLAAAHASGLVHRDFKPDNVLIGEDGRVRVLDFGIAGEVRKDARPTASDLAGSVQDAPLTMSGVIMGTPAYMAPEQFLGTETDERTDQYGFSVALWEALYGERPYQADTIAALAYEVWCGTLPDVRARDVPAWLTRIVTRGLSPLPAQRYRSMNALLADVDAGIASEASAARVVGKRYEPIQAHGDGSEATRRAIDRLTGQVVTLTWVGRAASPGEVSSRSAHAREFELLASLRHPNIASVLDFGFDHEQRAYFALGLRDQPTPLLEAARQQPRAIQLSWIVQLLRALAYLHRRDLAHGDLSPANVGVVGGQVIVSPMGASRADDATVARDLYAVGVMSYQLFGGRIAVEEAGSLHAGSFDVATLDAEPAVASVVKAMISDVVSVRYATASAVLSALSEAIGRPLPADTAETRESFLQAARLVGRDAEIAKLRAELVRAVEGHGSAWLVGGESGVGKSRLLDELRTLARVHGALVLRGQEESEGGSPYRLWQGALRWLAVATDASDVDASVLLPVVPDIAALIGRSVAPAPHLDAPSAHARLVEVVVGMLQRQPQPMLLLLEDVHWARSDSVKLLQAVAPLTSGLPLMIACSFRDDERPDLPSTLPWMQLLELGRLPVDQIASVGESMIGPVGRRADVVLFLERETEGNPFFLVEVVRALAEEAGSLDRIGTFALPDRVFAGGVRRVVQRRLRDLPSESRPLLRAAAIIGRKIDPAILRALSPDVDIEAWTERCVGAAVLERRDGVLRFSHDKLREGLLLEVGDDDRRALHAEIARVIERLHGDEATHGAALAHHWGAAGDRAKEAHYAALAGEQALESGARAEGMALLDRALALRDAVDGDPIERARLHRVLGVAAFEAGAFSSASEHGVEALALLGMRVPVRRARWVLVAVAQIAVLLWLLITPRRRKSDDARARRLIELARAASRLAIARVYELDAIPVLALSLTATAASLRAGTVDVYALGVLGFAAGAAGLRRLARRSFDRGRTEANAQYDESSLVDIEVMEAAFLVSLGDFDLARTKMTACAARAESVGYRLGGSSAESILARCDALTGDLDGMLAHFERSAELLRAYAPEHRAGQVAAVAMSLTLLGRHDEARARIAECVAPFESRLVRVSVTTLAGLVHAKTGDLTKARAAIDEATSLVGREHAYPAPLLELLEIPGDVYVTAWQRAREAGQAEVVLEAAARARLAALRSWARLCPIGGASAAILAARIHELDGDTRAAQREWQRAANLAEARGMRFHAALATANLRRASQSSAT